MAIVKCPRCDGRISSQISICPQCGFRRGEVDEEELRELRRREIRDKVYYLKMASYAVLTLLLAAFAWYWVETDSFKYRSSVGPYILFVIGATAYFIIRVFLFKFNLALRKIKRQ